MKILEIAIIKRKSLFLPNFKLKHLPFNDKDYSNARVSTQFNTSQHELVRVSTNQNKSNTNLHESNPSQRKTSRVNTNLHKSSTTQDKSIKA